MPASNGLPLSILVMNVCINLLHHLPAQAGIHLRPRGFIKSLLNDETNNLDKRPSVRLILGSVYPLNDLIRDGIKVLHGRLVEQSFDLAVHNFWSIGIGIGKRFLSHLISDICNGATGSKAGEEMWACGSGANFCDIGILVALALRLTADGSSQVFDFPFQVFDSSGQVIVFSRKPSGQVIMFSRKPSVHIIAFSGKSSIHILAFSRKSSVHLIDLSLQGIKSFDQQVERITGGIAF